MLKRLIIVGASGMGREVASYAKEALPTLSIAGFLDDRSDLLNSFDGLPPILGSVEACHPQKNDYYLVAVGDAEARAHYVDCLMVRGAHFATLIHPTAFVASSATLGEGCIICPQSAVSTNVLMGRHTILNLGASVSHDCEVADFCTLSPGARLTGACHLGQGCFLGVNASLIPKIHLSAYTSVGAGAVVIHAVPECHTTLAGVPAHEISRGGGVEFVA
ncbi:MAG: acetyltransferase, partial [Kiritimatiellia bacterium]